MPGTKRILRLDASANPGESNSHRLGDYLIRQLEQANSTVETRTRNLNQELSFIDSSWIAANFAAIEERSDDQLARLKFSDQLIAELH